MKFLKFLFPVVFAFGFAGCLDINETVDIKKDGSGQLTMDMDAGQALEMLQTFMSKEDMEKKGLQEKVDTTIYLKDVVDTMSSLSADKKALLHQGSVHVHLDMDAKVFTTHMVFPFKSQSDLQKLYMILGDGTLGNSRMMGMGGDEGGSPDFNQFNGMYDFVAKDGLLSKHVNQEKFKALLDNPQMAQLKQASQMGIEVNYTAKVLLPRPCKKVDNPLAQLSDDKKTVTIKYNMIEALDHPEKFNYSIEY